MLPTIGSAFLNTNYGRRSKFPFRHKYVNLAVLVVTRRVSIHHLWEPAQSDVCFCDPGCCAYSGTRRPHTCLRYHRFEVFVLVIFICVHVRLSSAGTATNVQARQSLCDLDTQGIGLVLLFRRPHHVCGDPVRSFTEGAWGEPHKRGRW